MTTSKVVTIIEKAKSDSKFAALILKEPVRALETYNLSRLEIKEVVDKVRLLNIRGIWPSG